MPKGYRIDWNEELESKLREWYPMHLDTVVAKELGISVKAMREHAKKIGLKKGEGYEEYYKKEQARIRKIAGQYVRNSGQFQKGCPPNEYSYKKGEKQPRERVERRAATLRKQYYEDAVRIKYGLEPKMKFHRSIKYDLTKYVKE